MYNDTTWNANNFNETDMELAANLNPAESNGWFPDLSDFRNSGGKMLLYHGGADPVGLPQSMMSVVMRLMLLDHGVGHSV